MRPNELTSREKVMLRALKECLIIIMTATQGSIFAHAAKAIESVDPSWVKDFFYVATSKKYKAKRINQNDKR